MCTPSKAAGVADSMIEALAVVRPGCLFPRQRSSPPPSCGACSAQGSRAAPPQPLLRCAPTGAAARREARENPRDEACPPAGGTGVLQWARSRGTSAKEPFVFPIRSVTLREWVAADRRARSASYAVGAGASAPGPYGQCSASRFSLAPATPSLASVLPEVKRKAVLRRSGPALQRLAYLDCGLEGTLRRMCYQKRVSSIES